MTEYLTKRNAINVLLLLLYYHMTEYFTNLILFHDYIFVVGRWGGTSQTSLRNSFRTEQGSSK